MSSRMIASIERNIHKLSKNERKLFKAIVGLKAKYPNEPMPGNNFKVLIDLDNMYCNGTVKRLKEVVLC